MGYQPMMKVMAPAHMKIKAGSRAMLVSLLRLLNVSFSDQAQIPMARIPKPRSWVQMRHEKLLHSIQVTHPKDDVESEDDILQTAGHLARVSDPPPSLVSGGMGMVRIPRRHPQLVAVSVLVFTSYYLYIVHRILLKTKL